MSECMRATLGDAVLGMAHDGGWWVLGVTDPAMADCLRTVPMSRADTGALTLTALRDTGINVDLIARLADVDPSRTSTGTARLCTDSRFARAT